MRSGWQDKVKAVSPRFTFLDPRAHGLKDSLEYAKWDLAAVRASDVVVAFLELSNPSGIGLALEVGYARALGKRIILIDEKSAADEVTARHFAIVRACADVVFDDFDGGLLYLRGFASPIRE